MKTIDCFREEYEFLSNFYPAPLKYKGITWATSEHAYQAMKSEDVSVWAYFANLTTPQMAKIVGKYVDIRSDWGEIKIDIMEEILVCKFSQNKHLREKLVATSPCTLIEGNWWGDTFWGMCKGVGKNHLGKLLMKIRDSYINEKILFGD